MLDQITLSIDEFKGLYDRGDTRDLNVTQIPPGFFKTLDNFYHQGESLISRPGSSALNKFSAAKLYRLWPYRKLNATDQFLVMYNNTTEYNIKDSGGGTSLQSITTGNDYQIFILRDKAFGGEIALNSALQQPLGTGNTKVYRLSGGAFRDAAGLSPSAGVPITAVTSATVGVVEVGVHLIAVAYETNTGFVTPPGVFVAAVYTPTQYTAPGGFKIDLSAIPIGPSGTIARHILASKVVRPPFNGDVLVPELFFVPGGKISDNVTTTLTIDFYDTSLVVSADYLLDEVEVIPAGTAYCVYRNRLVIVGFKPDASTVKGLGGIDILPSYVARVSNPGQYESFSSIEGFIQVFPNDGDALQACWEQNGNLYLAKGNRTYVARDNGGPPNTWPVELVDASIGCGPWGVTKVDNTQNSLIEGGSIIASRRGIYFFTGQYSTNALTYNIEALYRRKVEALGAFSDFYYTKIYYDSYRRLLYWLPFSTSGGKTGSEFILLGSCDMGLDPSNVRWSFFRGFNNSSARANPTANSFIRDIYTPTISPSADYLNTTLFIIFDDTSTTDIFAMRTTNSFDNQVSLAGTNIVWDILTFPANIPELDKLQVVGARALIKHDNPNDPVDFKFTSFDYTYNEEAVKDDIFFGDANFTPLRDMTMLPQLYDCGLNVRSKLPGIVLRRGTRGGNITNATYGTITNTVFIHRLMFFGNRMAQGKPQGNIR